MTTSEPKVFEYAVEVARDGRMTLPGGTPFDVPADWSPDHLLLAALVRCSIQSLAYHAGRAGHELHASGSASGAVTKRQSDGRYAFVRIDCRIEAQLEPPTNEVDDLLAKAERDCFVGASLSVTPHYDWRIS